MSSSRNFTIGMPCLKQPSRGILKAMGSVGMGASIGMGFQTRVAERKTDGKFYMRRLYSWPMVRHVHVLLHNRHTTFIMHGDNVD